PPIRSASCSPHPPCTTRSPRVDALISAPIVEAVAAAHRFSDGAPLIMAGELSPGTLHFLRHFQREFPKMGPCFGSIRLRPGRISHGHFRFMFARGFTGTWRENISAPTAFAVAQTA